VRSTINKTVALVLAAGGSRRFGSAKLLARFKGQSLLAHSLATAEAVLPGSVSVVLGAHGKELAAHTGSARVICNPDWEKGLSTSIIAGIAAMGEDVDHVLLLLAD
jgi:molybdenum cofactor cytidylyltransferase